MFQLYHTSRHPFPERASGLHESSLPNSGNVEPCFEHQLEHLWSILWLLSANERDEQTCTVISIVTATYIVRQ